MIDLENTLFRVLEQYHTEDTFDGSEGLCHLYFSKVLAKTDEGITNHCFCWFGEQPGIQEFLETATLVVEMEDKPLCYASIAPPHIFIVDKACKSIYLDLMVASTSDTPLDLFKFFYNPEECAVFKDELIRVV